MPHRTVGTGVAAIKTEAPVRSKASCQQHPHVECECCQMVDEFAISLKHKVRELRHALLAAVE